MASKMRSYRFEESLLGRVEDLVDLMKEHPEAKHLKPSATGVIQMMIEHALPHFEEKYKRPGK